MRLTADQIPHLRVQVTPVAGAGPWTLLGRRGGLPNLANFDWSTNRATDDGTYELLIPTPPAAAVRRAVGWAASPIRT